MFKTMHFKYGKVGSESPTEDEQPSHSGPGRVTFWTRICDITKWLRWPSTFFLLSLILAAEISILHKQPATLSIGSEINGIVPNFGTYHKKFTPDDRYNSDHKTQTSLNETKQNWLTLIPKGGGFIHVPNPTSHTLPPAMHFPSLPQKSIYSIAAIHQLHCLYRLTAFTDSLVLQMRAGNLTLDEAGLVHNNHCIDYLRNAVVCAADTTLEGQAVARGGREVPGTDGMGGVHVCRDWEGVVGWAEGRRLYDDLHL
ncbi:hypothetical protein EKO04_009006 [Ascochyta lentis]|uniref:Uncharacterized protein n=1 Tax=Ascochyta lentis TaxID=205686 RepID=A0A8H7IVB6_9PLEO|nr:hypothetical protein EKO04_009006 [Ascochyta lentis]